MVKTSPEDHQDKRRYAAENIIGKAGKGTFEDIGRKVKDSVKAPPRPPWRKNPGGGGRWRGLRPRPGIPRV